MLLPSHRHLPIGGAVHGELADGDGIEVTCEDARLLRVDVPVELLLGIEVGRLSMAGHERDGVDAGYLRVAEAPELVRR